MVQFRREFARSGQLVSATYSLGATGHKMSQTFAFLPIFRIQNA